MAQASRAFPLARVHKPRNCSARPCFPFIARARPAALLLPSACSSSRRPKCFPYPPPIRLLCLSSWLLRLSRGVSRSFSPFIEAPRLDAHERPRRPSSQITPGVSPSKIYSDPLFFTYITSPPFSPLHLRALRVSFRSLPFVLYPMLLSSFAPIER